MKRFVLLLCGLVLPGVLLAGTYKLDVSHTKVGFEVTHLVISTVEGRFTEFDGTFDFDEKKGVLSGVKVTIVSKSIDTANEKRDKHLRSDDFLDVGNYPTPGAGLRQLGSADHPQQDARCDAQGHLPGVGREFRQINGGFRYRRRDQPQEIRRAVE